MRSQNDSLLFIGYYYLIILLPLHEISSFNFKFLRKYTISRMTFTFKIKLKFIRRKEVIVINLMSVIHLKFIFILRGLL